VVTGPYAYFGNPMQVSSVASLLLLAIWLGSWSLAAMAASFVTSMILHLAGVNAGDTSSKDYAIAMLVTVGVTTAVWLTVTFLTAPESEAVLNRFYRKVRPGGVGWRPVSQRLGFGDDRIPGGALSWVNWVAGVTAVFTALFGVGAFLTGTAVEGVLYSVVSIAAFALIMRNLRADERLAASVDRTQAAGLGFSQSN